MRHLQQGFERKSERETEESSAELLSSGSISQNSGGVGGGHTLMPTQSSMNWWEINSRHKDVAQGSERNSDKSRVKCAHNMLIPGSFLRNCPIFFLLREESP